MLSKVFVKSTVYVSTLLKLDINQLICSLLLSNSVLFCFIGKFKTITFFDVNAQSVDVNALSIPPEIPITKPLVFE